MEAKLLKSNSTELTSTGYWTIERFEIDSIDPNASSGVIALPINAVKGILTEVKAECDSTNYDLHIASSPTERMPSIDTLYDKKGIDKLVLDTALQALWAKAGYADVQRADVPARLFATITNNAAVPTGRIVLEIVYQMHG